MVRDLFGFFFLLIFAGQGITGAHGDMNVDVRPDVMKVVAGNEALFICEVWGYDVSRTTVTWLYTSAHRSKRSKEPQSTIHQNTSSNKIVSIYRIRKTLKRHNGGTFTCQVNADQYKEASGILHVFKRNARGSFPRFISPPLVEVNDDGSVNLHCGPTDSRDTVNVTQIWIKDNTILTSSTGVNHNVTLTDDGNHAGVYQCVTITPRGTLISKLMTIEAVAKTVCKDRTGHRVKVGEMYNPDKDDPCTVCICQDESNGMTCSNENCDEYVAPTCQYTRKVKDSCCEYECVDSNEEMLCSDEDCEYYIQPACPNKKKVEGRCCEYECVNSSCIDSKGQTVAVGDEFNPAGGDLCTICICQEDPNMAICSSQGCDYPNCPNFIQLDDACCEFKCIEESKGEFALDIRQVKSNAVIVQWDATFEKDIDAIMVYYSEEIDRHDLMKSVKVSREQNYVVLTELSSNRNYFFKAQGISKLSLSADNIVSNLSQFTMDATHGNSLTLVPGLHDSIIKQIPSTGGQSIVHLNMNNFDVIDNCPDFDSKQCDYMSFYRYMQDVSSNAAMQLVKVMTLHFENVKDLRWARAHI